VTCVAFFTGPDGIAWVHKMSALKRNDLTVISCCGAAAAAAGAPFFAFLDMARTGRTRSLPFDGAVVD